jgi:hypothetical protein
VYVALGARFEIRTTHALQETVRDAYADLIAPAQPPAEHVLTASRTLTGRWISTLDGESRVSSRDRRVVLHDVGRAVNDLAVQSAAATDTVLTAAAVDVHDKAIAFVGQAGSGKTAVALAASSRGHGIIADGVVAIDPRGLVRPFHRPLGVPSAQAESSHRSVHVRGAPEDGYPVRMSRSLSLSSGARLGLVVMLEPGLTGGAAVKLSPATALFTLADQALRLADHGPAMFRRLDALVRTVPVFRVSSQSHEMAVGAALDALVGRT